MVWGFGNDSDVGLRVRVRANDKFTVRILGVLGLGCRLREL